MFQIIVLLSWERMREGETDAGTIFSTLSIGPLWKMPVNNQASYIHAVHSALLLPVKEGHVDLTVLKAVFYLLIELQLH